MLTNWLIPRSAAEGGDYIFQQDCTQPNWYLAVSSFLNANLPNRWIGHVGQHCHVFCNRLSNLPVCDFFLGDCVKKKEPLLLQVWIICRNPSLKLCTHLHRICWKVWQELDYRVDIGWAKRGHISTVYDQLIPRETYFMQLYRPIL